MSETWKARYRRFLGHAAVWVAWGLYLPGPLIGVVALLAAQPFLESNLWTWIVLGVAMAVVYSWNAMIGKHAQTLRGVGLALAARSANTLLKAKAPFVLYLRSFADDVPAHAARIGESSIEERLCQALEWIAPVVAIGKPGERFPALGAARLYVQDANWRRTALDLIEKARLLVIRIGDSPGLGWEISAVLDHARPEKILVFFDQKDSLHKRERAYAALSSELRRHGHNNVPQTVDRAVFMSFESAGAAQVLQPVGSVASDASGVEWDVEATLLPLYTRLLAKVPLRLGRFSRVVLLSTSAFTALLLDQAAKSLISGSLDPYDTIAVSSFINLVLIKNSGSVFGLITTSAVRTTVILFGSCVALYWLCRWAMGLPPYGNVHHVLRRVAAGLIIGGALGNLVDRIRLGVVIDFIDVHIGSWHSLAFNFADASIMIGVVLIGLAEMIRLLAEWAHAT